MKPNAVATLMAEDAKKPPPADKLEKLRQAVRTLRDVEFQRVTLNERLAELGTQVHELKTKTIVDLFDQAKVDNIGIPAEGNLPGYDIGVGWHYKANIGTPSDPKVEDFDKSISYIRKTDPDLLKTTFTIDFGLKDGKKMKAFEAMLKKQKISYSTSFGVPWNTLTAWLREQIEVKKKSPPLKLLGATVERTAKLLTPRANKADRATPKSNRGKGK
jgi:hypothetical protein